MQRRADQGMYAFNGLLGHACTATEVRQQCSVTRMHAGALQVRRPWWPLPGCTKSTGCALSHHNRCKITLGQCAVMAN